MDTFLYAQLQPFTLAGAGVNIGESTIVLTSFKTIDGVDLAMTDFGTIGFGTIEPGNGAQEEQISFSGVTQNSNGTATLTGIKTVLMLAPYTQTSNLAKTHAGGTVFVISNTAAFYDKLSNKSDDETITGDWHVPTPATSNSIANKQYVDDTATFGAPDASTSVKGIVKLSAAPTSPTDPIAVGTNDVKVSPVSLASLTSDKVAALAGTGTPNGTTGKYVTRDTLTSEEAAFELLANKDTTTTLGASDIKYPSQNAVKTYVDTNITNGVKNTAMSLSDTLQQSADTERSTNSSTPVKLKEIRINATGSVRVKYDGKATLASQGIGRTYVNGVAVGTSNTYGNSYATYSDDLTGLKSGDLVQIYVQGNSGTTYGYVKNFRIYFTTTQENTSVITD